MRLLLLLLLISSCSAQQLDKEFWAVSTLPLAGAAADAYTTHLGLEKGLHEANPLLGRHPSDFKLSAVELAGAAAIIGSGVVLRKAHSRFWWVPAVSYCGVKAFIAYHNYRVMN